MVAGKSHNRIEWVLVFNHYEVDSDGSKSRRYWPDEGRVWRWIFNCSEARRVARPFSLENLSLSHDYSGQDNARLIGTEDEEENPALYKRETVLEATFVILNGIFLRVLYGLPFYGIGDINPCAIGK